MSGIFSLIASSIHLLSQCTHGPPQYITALLSLTSTNSAQLSWADKIHCRLSRISLIFSSVLSTVSCFHKVITLPQRGRLDGCEPSQRQPMRTNTIHTLSSDILKLLLNPLFGKEGLGLWLVESMTRWVNDP